MAAQLIAGAVAVALVAYFLLFRSAAGNVDIDGDGIPNHLDDDIDVSAVVLDLMSLLCSSCTCAGRQDSQQ